MNITKRAKNIRQQWFLIDAENKILGRLSTRIADILSGKKRVYYSHDIVCGDFVVVINAEKIKLSANKMEKKIYYRHTGFPGGLKQKTAEQMIKHRPEYLIIEAVKGMLPQNRLRARLLKNLKIYKGAAHPHSAQAPIVLEFEGDNFKFPERVIEKIEVKEEVKESPVKKEAVKKEPEKGKTKDKAEKKETAKVKKETRESGKKNK